MKKFNVGDYVLYNPFKERQLFNSPTSNVYCGQIREIEFSDTGIIPTYTVFWISLETTKELLADKYSHLTTVRGISHNALLFLMSEDDGNKLMAL